MKRIRHIKPSLLEYCRNSARSAHDEKNYVSPAEDTQALFPVLYIPRQRQQLHAPASIACLMPTSAAKQKYAPYTAKSCALFSISIDGHLNIG